MEEGLHLYDVSTPSAPTWVSTLHTTGEVLDVVMDSSVVYIADLQSGLMVADYRDLAAPRLLGNVDTPEMSANGIAISGNRICIADYESGLHIALTQCSLASPVPGGLPSPLAALTFCPNPFNPRTTIAYELPGPVVIDLKVFDVSGRLVRALVRDIKGCKKSKNMS